MLALYSLSSLVKRKKSLLSSDWRGGNSFNLASILARGETRTYDLGGAATTLDMARAVAAAAG
jgi:hypothetical protein